MVAFMIQNIKNKKSSIYIVFFFLIVASALTYLHFTKKTFSSIPISLGSANTPLAHVEIQGSEYLLQVDSGCKFELVLNKEVLSHLEKHPCGTLESRDAGGKTYQSKAYILPKIKIGDFYFKNVVANEMNEDYEANITYYTEKKNREEIFKTRLGYIGRGLLEKMNILLDVPNSVIVLCDDMKQLSKAGYRVTQSVGVPFETGRAGTVLTTDTDLGKIRLSIDTGSTVSFIRSSLLQSYACTEKRYGLPYFTTSRFEIGNKDYKNIDLYLLDITSELHEIDGILGMNFLEKQAVYIDYKNKAFYIVENQ